MEMSCVDKWVNSSFDAVFVHNEILLSFVKTQNMVSFTEMWMNLDGIFYNLK